MKRTYDAEFFDGKCPYTGKPCYEWECNSCEVEAQEKKNTEESYKAERSDKEMISVIEQIQAEIEQAKLKGDIRTMDYCMAFNDGLNDALTIVDKYKERIRNDKRRSSSFFKSLEFIEKFIERLQAESEE